MIRPATAPKPDVDVLRGSGVEIRLGDLADSVEQLTHVLQGVDIDISAVDAFVIPQQKNLAHAAKAAGVKRFVPCDFGTPGAQGVGGPGVYSPQAGTYVQILMHFRRNSKSTDS